MEASASPPEAEGGRALEVLERAILLVAKRARASGRSPPRCRRRRRPRGCGASRPRPSPPRPIAAASRLFSTSFLERGGRALDDLAGSDLVHQQVGQCADVAHRGRASPETGRGEGNFGPERTPMLHSTENDGRARIPLGARWSDMTPQESPAKPPESTGPRTNPLGRCARSRCGSSFRFSLVGYLATLLVVFILGAVLWTRWRGRCSSPGSPRSRPSPSAATRSTSSSSTATRRRPRSRAGKGSSRGHVPLRLCWAVIATVLLPDSSHLAQRLTVVML